jgi:hypothetical protein
MFRNYDGKGHRFGTTSVRARSLDATHPGRPNGGQDRLSLYAAQRPDGTLTAMVINKTGGALRSRLSLAGFRAKGPAQVWRYGQANPNRITRLSNAALSGNALVATYPGNSLTLLVIPRA